MRAVVTAERVDLDPWAASFWPGTGAPNLIAAAATFGPLALDLRLLAEAATLRGIAATDVTLDLAATPGRIEVRQMAAQALGAAASASLTLLEGGRIADAKAELKAARATGFTPYVVQALGRNFAARLEPLLRGALLLQLQAGGAPGWPRHWGKPGLPPGSGTAPWRRSAGRPAPGSRPRARRKPRLAPMSRPAAARRDGAA